MCESRLIGGNCHSIIYDVSNDQFMMWRDADGRPITEVSFSEDGTKAVFVVETGSTFLGFGKYETRIALADVRDGRYRFITPGPGVERYPEFWKDGFVIYVGTDPDDPGQRKSQYLYVAEPGEPPRKVIETGFYAPSRPRPHWDGEQIFMAEFKFTEAGRNEILAIRPSDGAIGVINVPPSLDYHSDFFQPAVARVAQRIYFDAILTKESNQPQAGYRYDIFFIDGRTLQQISKIESKLIRRRVQGSDVYVLKGQAAQRISWLAGYVSGMDVTDDGRYLALITADTSKRGLQNYRLLIYDPQTRTGQELNPYSVKEQLFYQQDK